MWGVPVTQIPGMGQLGFKYTYYVCGYKHTPYSIYYTTYIHTYHDIYMHIYIHSPIDNQIITPVILGFQTRVF